MPYNNYISTRKQINRAENSMGLKELNIKPAYDSEEDDVLTAFYIPLLSQSVSYNRLAGFFSSTALAVAAKGIAAFVANSGHMKLVAGAKLSKPDIEAIQRGIKERDKVIAETMLKDLDSLELEDEFIRDHIRALGWMVANKKLDIKVAIVTDENGSLLDEESIEKRGIFHQKIGIFEDKEGNSVSFSGSINESATAWTQNIEEFNVFRSWIEGEKEHLKGNYHKFEKYWRGAAKHAKVVDIPFAVREKLIQIAPERFDELKLVGRLYSIPTWVKKVEYQDIAVDEWFKKGKKGILEMATGTGKTVVAMKAICRFVDQEKRAFIMIVCPQKHLVDQWNKNASSFGFSPILAYQSRTLWEENLNQQIISFNHKFREIVFVITTYQTFISEPMQKAINRIDRPEVLFIADEVHTLGAKVYRRSIPSGMGARMGLSATPTRYFDPEGTNVLLEYFGEIVFKYPLKKAIENGYLCKYEYYPQLVELNEEEREEYLELTKKIVIKISKISEKDNLIFNDEHLERLFEKRAKIINRAESKLGAIEELVEKEKNLHHALFYCAEGGGQLENVLKMLGEKGYRVHRFTDETQLEERKKLLSEFEKGNIQALVAMKCLDVGVDVPNTETAFFLSSSSNPIQFIQRRGRILRTSKDKKLAKIHDLIVVPVIDDPAKKLSDSEFNMERVILRRELVRFKEFANDAENKQQATESILKVVKAYNLLDEI